MTGIHRIDSISGRKKLALRREPYWHRVAPGQALGYRVLSSGAGTWVARWTNPDDSTQKNTHALGAFTDYSESERFDKARAAAVVWFQQCVGGRPEVITVAQVCAEYVEDRRKVKGANCAADAEGRFKRTVYGHKIAKQELHKLTSKDLKRWLEGLIDEAIDDDDDLDSLRAAKDSANRNLASIKAALNYGFVSGYCPSPAEWNRVRSFGRTAKRRERYLTSAERKALLLAASPELQRFIKAMLLTACRPAELTNALVSHFDARKKCLTVDGKTGRRTIPLTDEAVQHLKNCAEDKSLDSHLISRNNGQTWSRYLWRDQMQRARKAANLGEDISMYSLRHAAITDLCVAGIDLLSVARIAGTSIQMISSNYGHLNGEVIGEKLRSVKLL